MYFIASGNTDIGLTKNTNQDSLLIKIIKTYIGEMVLAVICDGMGGLSKGEVASASVINEFNNWSQNKLPALCRKEITDSEIRLQWEDIIQSENRKIKNYGARNGIRLGTTVTAMLITESRYYIIHVGDSRAYEISVGIRQLTDDQTFVAREVKRGFMTPEQALVDSRRSVLLQCVGASEDVVPTMYYGQTLPNTIYMLCCDGFIHEIGVDEIYNAFNPNKMIDEYTMNQAALSMIALNKQRKEKDNITVALIKTC